MPIYEYKCKKCGSTFEVLQKVNDPLLKRCIHCGGPAHKTLSAPALQFKGSGWYITDYSKKNQQKEKKTESDKPKEKTLKVKMDQASK